MGKYRYIFVLLIVLVITIFTRWLLTSVDQSTELEDRAKRHHPDYFIRNFDAVVYDGTGKSDYRLIANHLEHFPDDDTMAIEVLRLIYFDESNQEWVTTSDRGTAYKDIQLLKLVNNVKVVRNSPEPVKRMTLFTEELDIDFIKRLATTEREVKIIGKNSTIVATGMLLDIDGGKITLKHKARAEYAPQK